MRIENRGSRKRGKIKCGEREGMIEGRDDRGKEGTEREGSEGGKEREGKGIIKSGLIQVYEHIVV